jgi:hypothetical protein
MPRVPRMGNLVEDQKEREKARARAPFAVRPGAIHGVRPPPDGRKDLPSGAPAAKRHEIRRRVVLLFQGSSGGTARTSVARAAHSPSSASAVTSPYYRPVKVGLGTFAVALCAAWAWRQEAKPTPVASPFVEARAAIIPTPLIPDLAPPRVAPEPPKISDDPTDAPRIHFTRTFDAAAFRRGNLHSHSNRSDGDSPPAEVYGWYRAHGYDFIAVTDHNTFTNPAEFVTEPQADFLVIGGEEVTMRGGGREVHMNALCTRRSIPGGTFPSAREALAHGVLEIRTAGGIALINHPNFTWGVKASDLAAAAGSNLIEIYSGHPFVPSDGRPGSPSHETMWDMALTEGLDYTGVAVDDMHRLRADRRRVSRPGKAWVEVFADKLDAPTICEALENGMLYSSTGPVLRRVRVTDDTYGVWPVDHNVDVIFIGSGGRVLARRRPTGPESSVAYGVVGTEGYVRARIVRADGKVAWTPAVRVHSTGVPRAIANPTAPQTRPPG